jgi:type II secretory pathway predicted ATPase ExeA
MYHAHWGLNASPFGGGAVQIRRADAAGPFAEALARLQYLVDQQGRVGLVLGVPGTGKTTLLRSFVDAARRKGSASAFVAGAQCDGLGFLDQFARGWQIALGREAAVAQRWERITDRLAELRYEQTVAVVAVDDIDGSARELRGHLERLLGLAQAHQARLTVLLSSASSSPTVLGSTLTDEVELRVDLLPWSEEETAEHVARRLFTCGSPTPIFTDDAITVLHELSGGIPRKVEQIAQLALLAGAGRQLAEIDAEMLVQSFEALGFAQVGQQVL